MPATTFFCGGGVVLFLFILAVTPYVFCEKEEKSKCKNEEGGRKVMMSWVNFKPQDPLCTKHRACRCKPLRFR